MCRGHGAETAGEQTVPGLLRHQEHCEDQLRYVTGKLIVPGIFTGRLILCLMRNVFVVLGTTESRRCWSGSDRQTDVLRYVSEERCLALRLCGWISRGPDIDVEIFLRTLEQEREWERAAAVALFNLDIRRAIQILNKGAMAEKGE